MCDWTDCTKRATWLLQASFAPSDMRASTQPDIDSAFCHDHMVAAVHIRVDALLTTASRVTISRTR